MGISIVLLVLVLVLHVSTTFKANPSSTICNSFPKKQKLSSHDVTRQKARASPNAVGLILYGPLLSVQPFKATHLISVGIFQTKEVGWPTDRHPQSLPASLANKIKMKRMCLFSTAVLIFEIGVNCTDLIAEGDAVVFLSFPIVTMIKNGNRLD